MLVYVLFMTIKHRHSMYLPPKDFVNALLVERGEMLYISSWNMNRCPTLKL